MNERHDFREVLSRPSPSLIPRSPFSSSSPFYSSPPNHSADSLSPLVPPSPSSSARLPDPSHSSFYPSYSSLTSTPAYTSERETLNRSRVRYHHEANIRHSDEEKGTSNRQEEEFQNVRDYSKDGKPNRLKSPKRVTHLPVIFRIAVFALQLTLFLILLCFSVAVLGYFLERQGVITPCITPVEEREHIKYMIHAFDKVMEELGIPHWLDYGTLLGAYRRGGVLPWDHDGDVGFLREDIERVKRSLTSHSAASLMRHRYKILLNSAAMTYKVFVSASFLSPFLFLPFFLSIFLFLLPSLPSSLPPFLSWTSVHISILPITHAQNANHMYIYL